VVSSDELEDPFDMGGQERGMSPDPEIVAMLREQGKLVEESGCTEVRRDGGRLKKLSAETCEISRR